MPLEIDLSKVPAPILESLILEGLRTLHKPKKSLAPPKRWRNRWRAQVSLLEVLCPCHGSRWFTFGQTYPGCKTWPTKDIAETKARELEAEDLVRYGLCPGRWINAYPDPD